MACEYHSSKECGSSSLWGFLFGVGATLLFLAVVIAAAYWIVPQIAFIEAMKNL